MYNLCEWHRTTPTVPPVCAVNVSRKSENPEISLIFMIFIFFFNFNILVFFNFSRFSKIFGAVCRQMDLSPSSRGVGWANGCCCVVFVICTSRLVAIWSSGNGLEMIFGGLNIFFTFFHLIYHIRPPNFVNPLCKTQMDVCAS